MKRRFFLLPVIWLVALLLLPAAAWVAGVRQPILENRPKNEFPVINRSSLRVEKTYAAVEAAILDRLPFRGEAVELRGRLGVELFRDSPNPMVRLGRDGWLFYNDEFRSCRDDGRSAQDPADVVDVLSRSIVASGRRGGVTVAGSKVIAEKQYLRGVDAELQACVAALEGRVHQRLATSPGGIDVQGRLTEESRAGRAVFLKNDTHWNDDSRLIFAQTVLDRIRPGLADEVQLKKGTVTVETPADMGPFIGLPRSDGRKLIGATRAPSKPFVAGDLTFLGDSQLDGALFTPGPDGTSIAERVFPGQAHCSWFDLAGGICDEAIRNSRVLVIESVARHLNDVASTCWRPVSVLAGDLRGAPGRWQRTDGARSPRGSLRLGAVPATVRAVLPGGDTSDVPRLIRIPVERLTTIAGQPATPVAMAQQPQGGEAAPCATPSQGVAGGSLLLPVPRGRKASELLATFAAPAGTELGRPQEIVLDGRRVARDR